MKKVIRLNESQLQQVIRESIKNVLKESSSTIIDVEDLCKYVGCSLDNQEEAQFKIEQILNYLRRYGVIDRFNEDRLDWVFSDEEAVY
jgi:uncharacterized protein YgfB (UPF0149 family)